MFQNTKVDVYASMLINQSKYENNKRIENNDKQTHTPNDFSLQCRQQEEPSYLHKTTVCMYKYCFGADKVIGNMLRQTTQKSVLKRSTAHHLRTV